MNENIIGINVPNGISILIMAAIGGILVAAIRKAAGKKSSGVTSGPVFSGSGS